MISNINQTIRRTIANFSGWRTNRKLVVIESDDWGSIRMPSREVYDSCLKAGYRVDLNEFERLDSLASKNDLELLFNLLMKHTDSVGNHPVITANCVVANPDFNKMKDNDFNEYHYELITDTFKRYPKHGDNFELWMQGYTTGIFHPQYHAREHLNVSMFMSALQNGNSDVHWGFKHGMPGSIPMGTTSKGNDYVEATHFNSEMDKQDKLDIYLEGLAIFEKLFGYKSKSIIPTNYIWHQDFDIHLAHAGVKYIQSVKKYIQPSTNDHYQYVRRILGRKTKGGLIELVRNVIFEPSADPSNKIVNNVLRDIGIAFKMKKPAIMCSHRINYVGFIDETNRDRNLRMLDYILKEIIKTWPDVEFVTSDQLGEVIENQN